MPRPPRADEAGGLYHALNRGKLRATIFHKDSDYEAFERILYEDCRCAGVRLGFQFPFYGFFAGEPIRLIVQFAWHLAVSSQRRFRDSVLRTSPAAIVSLIGNTLTTSSRVVHAWIDEKTHEKARRVTNKKLAEVEIRRNKFYGEWI